MSDDRERSQPALLVKWYDYTKWVLERVDSFPKNQRFVLGTRLADGVVLVMELLAESAYAGRTRKRELLEEVNRKIEVVRWLMRLVHDRKLIANRQFLFSWENCCQSCRASGAEMEDRGRFVLGARGEARAADRKSNEPILREYLSGWL